MACGGPSRNVSGWIIVQEGYVIPRCCECDGAVDERGRTVVGVTRDGRAVLVVIEEIGVDMPPMERPAEPPPKPKPAYEPPTPEQLKRREELLQERRARDAIPYSGGWLDD